MFRVYHVFLTVHCIHVVTCWERAVLLALLYVIFYYVFVTFLCDVLGQVWCLIVLIPDLFFFLTVCNQDTQQRFDQDGNQSLISLISVFSVT